MVCENEVDTKSTENVVRTKSRDQREPIYILFLYVYFPTAVCIFKDWFKIIGDRRKAEIHPDIFHPPFSTQS